MADILIADIGGTTSRAAFASIGGRPERIVTIANDSVDGPEGVLARLLDGAPHRPRAAVLAFAAPVNGDEIALTNRNWCVRLPDLSARFGISSIHAVNDFEALAWALPLLRRDDLQPIGGDCVFPPGVKLVIGPGTGLGVAALVPTRDGLHVIASEAGHSSFGPAYADEESVFHRLAEQNAPLSAESVLSGTGLAALHDAMHPGTLRVKPEMIVRQAAAGNREARATVAMFVRLLGRFAGDMALSFRASGGVYVAGGVATGLGPLFDARLFRAAFERHPPYEAMLKAMPSALITCAEPGLIGCVAVAERLMRKA
ncbi:MAG: glucokinase [Pseudorhodoplanes sp.]|uniref:glucokinase n=1 Tax=Pseudorhodoplanes sp. TaxID=1934341 RepID=UPI003D0AFE28